MRPALLVLLLLATLISWLSSVAQGTAFTYQGRLRDSGTPATGIRDLRFAIYDAASGGNQVGSTVTADDVALTNGLFNVVLDFGASVFVATTVGWKSNCGPARRRALTPR